MCEVRVLLAHLSLEFCRQLQSFGLGFLWISMDFWETWSSWLIMTHHGHQDDPLMIFQEKDGWIVHLLMGKSRNMLEVLSCFQKSLVFFARFISFPNTSCSVLKKHSGFMSSEMSVETRKLLPTQFCHNLQDLPTVFFRCNYWSSVMPSARPRSRSEVWTSLVSVSRFRASKSSTFVEPTDSQPSMSWWIVWFEVLVDSWYRSNLIGWFNWKQQHLKATALDVPKLSCNLLICSNQNQVL